MEKTILHKSEERGHANHGWLDTHHSFSFANYHDPEKIHFGALRVLNDDLVKGGYGFGKHPHDNMEIITVVLEGALEHQDSMGHTQAIHPDEVQVMSAGTGVTHSEYNHNPDQDVRLLQIWIFPAVRNIQPRYDQRVFAKEERINKWQVLASPDTQEAEGLKLNQDAWIYRTQLEKGQTLDLKAKNPGHGLYTFVIEGKITLGETTLGRRDALGLSGSPEISISAIGESDVLVLEVPMYA